MDSIDSRDALIFATLFISIIFIAPIVFVSFYSPNLDNSFGYLKIIQTCNNKNDTLCYMEAVETTRIDSINCANEIRYLDTMTIECIKNDWSKK